MKLLLRIAPVCVAFSFAFACTAAQNLPSYEGADASIIPAEMGDEESEAPPQDAAPSKDAAAKTDTGHSTASEDPVVVLSLSPSVVTSPGEVHFNVKVTNSNSNPIQQVVIEQDGYEFSTFTSPPYSGFMDVTAADNGAYTFTATATDSANNVGVSKAVKLTIAIDAGSNDAGPNDAGPNDAGPKDAGPKDAATADAADAKAPPGTKRVFVTAGTYTSNLKLEGNGATGPDGADKLCNKEAQTSGLGGTWKAWIRETGVGSGALRVGVHGPWARMDGYLVFPGTSVSGLPLVPINRTPLNQEVTNNPAVYTALYDDGTSTASNFDCGGWTGFGGYVNMGACTVTKRWSWAYYGVNYVCNQQQARLYCFEQ